MLLAISFIIGVLFGAIFGIVDVEDYSRNRFILYIAVTREIELCEPIGFFIGMFTGFMLEFLRQEELANRPDKEKFSKEKESEQ